MSEERAWLHVQNEVRRIMYRISRAAQIPSILTRGKTEARVGQEGMPFFTLPELE